MDALKQRPRARGKKPPSKQFIQQMNKTDFGFAVSIADTTKPSDQSNLSKTSKPFSEPNKKLSEPQPSKPFAVKQKTNQDSRLSTSRDAPAKITHDRPSATQLAKPTLFGDRLNVDSRAQSGATSASGSTYVTPRESLNSTPTNSSPLKNNLKEKQSSPIPPPKVHLSQRSSHGVQEKISSIDLLNQKNDKSGRASCDTTKQYPSVAKKFQSPKSVTQDNQFLNSHNSPLQKTSQSARVSEVQSQPIRMIKNKFSGMENANSDFIKDIQKTPPTETKDSVPSTETKDSSEESDSDSRNQELMHQRSKMNKKLEYTRMKMSDKSFRNLSKSRRLESSDNTLHEKSKKSGFAQKGVTIDSSTKSRQLITVSIEDSDCRAREPASDGGPIRKSSPLVRKSDKPQQ